MPQDQIQQEKKKPSFLLKNQENEQSISQYSQEDLYLQDQAILFQQKNEENANPDIPLIQDRSEDMLQQQHQKLTIGQRARQKKADSAQEDYAKKEAELALLQEQTEKLKEQEKAEKESQKEDVKEDKKKAIKAAQKLYKKQMETQIAVAQYQMDAAIRKCKVLEGKISEKEKVTIRIKGYTIMVNAIIEYQTNVKLSEKEMRNVDKMLKEKQALLDEADQKYEEIYFAEKVHRDIESERKSQDGQKRQQQSADKVLDAYLNLKINAANMETEYIKGNITEALHNIRIIDAFQGLNEDTVFEQMTVEKRIRLGEMQKVLGRYKDYVKTILLEQGINYDSSSAEVSQRDRQHAAQELMEKRKSILMAVKSYENTDGTKEEDNQTLRRLKNVRFQAKHAVGDTKDLEWLCYYHELQKTGKKDLTSSVKEEIDACKQKGITSMEDVQKELASTHIEDVLNAGEQLKILLTQQGSVDMVQMYTLYRFIKRYRQTVREDDVEDMVIQGLVTQEQSDRLKQLYEDYNGFSVTDPLEERVIKQILKNVNATTREVNEKNVERAQVEINLENLELSVKKRYTKNPKMLLAAHRESKDTPINDRILKSRTYSDIVKARIRQSAERYRELYGSKGSSNVQKLWKELDRYLNMTGEIRKDEYQGIESEALRKVMSRLKKIQKETQNKDPFFKELLLLFGNESQGYLEVPDSEKTVRDGDLNLKDTAGKKLIMTDKKTQPLFLHEPEVNDIKQGGLGDCYLIASLAEITARYPQKIKESMRDNQDGTVTVRFFDDKKKPLYIRVEKTVPTNNDKKVDKFAKNCLWVQMIEKAYAASKLHPKTKNIQGKVSYYNIGGGTTTRFMQHFLGVNEKTYRDNIKDTAIPIGGVIDQLSDDKEINKYRAKLGTDPDPYLAYGFEQLLERDVMRITWEIADDREKRRMIEVAARCFYGNRMKLTEVQKANKVKDFNDLQDREVKDIEYVRFLQNVLNEDAQAKRYEDLSPEEFRKLMEDCKNKMIQYFRIEMGEITVSEEDDLRTDVEKTLCKGMVEKTIVNKQTQKPDIAILKTRLDEIIVWLSNLHTKKYNAKKNKPDSKAEPYTENEIKQYERIEHMLRKDGYVTAQSVHFQKTKNQGATGEYMNNGLCSQHAYTVFHVDLDAGHRYVWIRNPWGKTGFTYDDKNGKLVRRAQSDDEENKNAGVSKMELHEFCTLMECKFNI